MDWTEDASKFLEMWVQGQKSLAESQEKFFANFGDQMSKSTPPSADPLALAPDMEVLTETGRKVAEVWRSFMAFCGTLSEVLPAGGQADDDARTALGKLMDPARLIGAGMTDLDKTIRRLTETPELADMGEFERKFMKTSSAWLELRRRSGEYQGVVMGAWITAMQRLMTKLKEKSEQGESVESWRQLTDIWLGIANDSLVETHRSKQFLEAQSNLLRAGTQYRLREREITEIVCEAKSIPTRTEIDDLHRTVHELRRELRELKHTWADILALASEGDADNEKKPSKKRRAAGKVAAKGTRQRVKRKSAKSARA